MLTAAVIKELLFYDAETGYFYWKVKPSMPVKAGSKAGVTTPLGYTMIKLFGRKYAAHRLAWLYVNGEWPAKYLDHINGNPGDNRIKNLREATKGENNQNLLKAQKNSKSKLLGVSLHKSKKWVAQISVNYKKINLGLYETPELAYAAYVTAKRNLHKFSQL